MAIAGDVWGKRETKTYIRLISRGQYQSGRKRLRKFSEWHTTSEQLEGNRVPYQWQERNPFKAPVQPNRDRLGPEQFFDAQEVYQAHPAHAN
jgi:hypothetical protein